MIECLVPDWPAPPAVRAAVSTRAGGVSGAPWDSLNLGDHVGDDPACVAENRRLLRAQLGLPAGSITSGMTIGKASITLKR